MGCLVTRGRDTQMGLGAYSRLAVWVFWMLYIFWMVWVFWMLYIF